MGLAELVPGISGGTIAFVTEIYAQLVGTLARFGPASIVQLGQPKLFWQQHNLGFLLSLVFGMGLGIILLAPGVRFLLANAAPLLWAFFFGLIWASVIFIGRARSRQTNIGEKTPRENWEKWMKGILWYLDRRYAAGRSL